eukprot:9205956-Pyramimonas_sp.AAC.1
MTRRRAELETSRGAKKLRGDRTAMNPTTQGPQQPPQHPHHPTVILVSVLLVRIVILILF